MNEKLSSVVLAVILSSAAPGVAARQADADAPSSNNRSSFVKAAALADDAAFEFSAGGHTYRVNANGTGKRMRGYLSSPFNLPVGVRERVEKIYYAKYDDGLLLICSLSGGTGFVAKLRQHSLRVEWRREIPSPNVGEPLLKDGHVYLTARDFVARLDARKGDYVWRLDRRDMEGRVFEHFALPEVKGGRVLFKELTADAPVRTLVVRRGDGTIIGVE